MKVRCINNYAAEFDLKIGESYTVIHENELYYYLLGKSHHLGEQWTRSVWTGGWNKDRFVIVEDLLAGWIRCKCGTLTSNSLCCECKGKSDVA
jgi:hypothetical protein